MKESSRTFGTASGVGRGRGNSRPTRMWQHNSNEDVDGYLATSILSLVMTHLTFKRIQKESSSLRREYASQLQIEGIMSQNSPFNIEVARPPPCPDVGCARLIGDRRS